MVPERCNEMTGEIWANGNFFHFFHFFFHFFHEELNL